MLTERISLQDAESFSDLFTRTQLRIFRFIYGLHGGPTQEVEDLTCDTYLRAWNGRKSFSGNEHDALCWLFTIARHLVIDAHRRRKTHVDDSPAQLDDLALEALVSPAQDNPEVQAARREQLNHLWKLLLALPVERRELLVLRYMLGWQVKQIAAFFKMEENTVSVYIRRSLEQIRQDWIEE